MKNIHLIPTDKASRLAISENKNLIFTLSPISWLKNRNKDFYNQNIYITSSEEIKEGWYFNTSKGINRAVFIKNEDVKGLKGLYGEKANHLEKIILTTDTKIIEDGVQVIDNKFLEWFVKNSSCEFVEVKSQHIDEFGNYIDDSFHSVTDSYLYKTIIPKEEVLIQSSIDGEVIWSTAKETLEEVAERILFKNTNNIEIHYRGGKENVIKAMIEIAKWQQEKQDEFAIGFLNSIRDYELENGSRICFDERDSKELLEIYKKKYERNT